MSKENLSRIISTRQHRQMRDRFSTRFRKSDLAAWRTPGFPRKIVLTFAPFTLIYASSIFRSRKALLITETELRLIAAAASIGLSSRPNTGYRMPAATGTPMLL